MLFKSINIKSSYSSRDSDIIKEFYFPVLKEAVVFDRLSAFFSAKMLANIAEGLEFFAKNGGKCRLILSKNISKEDFDKIKEGYDLREYLNKQLLEDLDQRLNIAEEKHLSNLAYLIGIGVVDIKIAFVRHGLFHHKSGVYIDSSGNKIVTCGSDNFTDAAYSSNGETFHVTCNWLCSEFDYQKIISTEEKFNNLWSNNDKEAVVLDVDKVIHQKIAFYNKGELVMDEAFLNKNCFILDYSDNRLIGHNNLNIQDALYKAVYKIYLQRYIDTDSGNIITFKSGLSYRDFKKIINIFIEKLPNIDLKTTKALDDYINTREIYIEDRANLGLLIKARDEKFVDRLTKYKITLEDSMSRELRPSQLWDSFFMYMMKKSSNFSVPGSGKTTSVLGVFANLQARNEIDRIVVISPLNAFGAWVDEFNECFKGKLKLNCFNGREKSAKEISEILNYNKNQYNMFLFNYESLRRCRDEISNLVKDRTLLVFDEVHKVKGVKAKRAEDALMISKEATHVITMTGTPIPNSYQDIYNNLNILFADEYSDFFNLSPENLINLKEDGIKQINNKLLPFFCRTSKEQLGVPAANPDDFIDVGVTDIENKLFGILYSKFRNNRLAFIVRALQLESCPKMLLEKIDPDDFRFILDENDEIENLDFTDYSKDISELINSIDYSSKTKECINLVAKLIKENKPVVVWTIFKKSIDNIQAGLKDIGIDSIVIKGDVPPQDRDTILNHFKNGSVKVLITNPHTLAEAVSLHKSCHDAIYFEYSYNLVHLLQSKDRIHRLGLSDNQYTQYYFLGSLFNFNNSEYSLDRQIYDRLKVKEQIMLEAVNNNALECPVTEEEDLNAIFSKLGI